jgi:hypothetical protein
MLTRDHANEIARKLGAEINKKRAHQIAVIYVNGKFIASFGIRHGSKRDAGHDHIPRDIYFPPNKCLRLAQCSLNLPDWIKSLKEQGKIED